MPSARSRAGPSGKVVVSRDIPVGTMAAAPRPCSALPVRKDAGSQEKVASREAAPNRARPVRNSRMAAVEVADAAEQEQETAGRERERGDRPLEGGLAHAEVGAEGGQGHVEDGEVQGDHELGRAEDEEDELVARREFRSAEWFVDGGSGRVGRHGKSFRPSE